MQVLKLKLKWKYKKADSKYELLLVYKILK